MNRKNRSKIPHEEIIKLYLNLVSTTKIAKLSGISAVAVLNILKRNNILIRSKEVREKLKRKYNYDEIVKDYQSGMFLQSVAKKYNIGPSHILIILNKYGIKSRGMEDIKRGEAHPSWKGGKTNDKDGYIIEKRGRVHRLKMEEKLNRKLFFWEDVHHVDGNKKNYSLDNLVVIPSREHTRFHTFLRQIKFEINKENLEKFCKKESEFYYRFTTENLQFVCNKYNFTLKSIAKRIRKKCIIKNCNNLRYGRKLCSKHWQRKRAKDRGYWVSSKGRISKFIGKFGIIKLKTGRNA